jgi:putative restriction endonuclease
MERKNWSREDLIVAFAAYCRTPFGRIHSSNPEIISLASLLERTPNAVAMKMVNFARLDPVLQARGISGLSHGSKAEEILWNEFKGNTEQVALEAELAIRKLAEPAEAVQKIPDWPTDAQRLVKVRLVQSFFRRAVLASYNFTCSFCGLQISQMLVASHIIPWKANLQRRADPSNGICLCAFHDRAFDRGVLSVDESLKIVVSNSIEIDPSNDMASVGLSKLQGKLIQSAERFMADPLCFDYHRQHIFIS